MGPFLNKRVAYTRRFFFLLRVKGAYLCCRLPHLTRSPGHAGAGGARSMMCWMKREHPDTPFERYADDAIYHAEAKHWRLSYVRHWKRGLWTASYDCIRK
jgi:hypothetical protein